VDVLRSTRRLGFSLLKTNLFLRRRLNPLIERPQDPLAAYLSPVTFSVFGSPPSLTKALSNPVPSFVIYASVFTGLPNLANGPVLLMGRPFGGQDRDPLSWPCLATRPRFWGLTHTRPRVPKPRCFGPNPNCAVAGFEARSWLLLTPVPPRHDRIPSQPALLSLSY